MEKFALMSHNGEDKIQCCLELPAGKPRGVVQILHGMCEFYDRYEELRGELLSHGFAVCGHDHVGHGASVTDESRYGYFGAKEGHRVLTLDAHNVTVHVKEKVGSVPFFLLGHSMGSFVARDYIAKYGKELSGAVIVGTSGPNPAVGAGIALARSVGAVRGKLYRSQILNNIVFGSYNKRIENPVSKYDWLSRDGEVLRKYAGDKRCTFIFTAKGFEDMFTLLRRVNRKDWASKVPTELPLLLMAGTEDPVGNYGKGVEWVQGALQTAGASSELLLYPGMRHEIFNEKDNDKVYEDLSLWLENHL